MPKVDLSWEQLGVELGEWERKLASGHATLREAADVRPGCSARRLLHTAGRARLYRYEATNPDPLAVPTLVVYALVNRPTMADLEPERSLVRSLLALGVDVHLIEWEDPTGLDCASGLSDYIERDLGACVDFLAAAGRGVNLVGICQGGTFALCYAALHPDKVRNLVVTVTPVDFHTPDVTLSHWLCRRWRMRRGKRLRRSSPLARSRGGVRVAMAGRDLGGWERFPKTALDS